MKTITKPNIGSYEERVKGLNWAIAEEELGYKPGDDINIGWLGPDMQNG